MFRVKRWGYILLEIMAVCAASGMLFVGGYRLVGARRTHLGSVLDATDGDAWLERRPPPRQAGLPAPPAVAVSEQPLGTFFGLDDELVLAHLRTQSVTEVKPNHGGSSISLRVTFKSGARAAFKPEQTNPQTVPRKEVAAYRLSRWLGLRAVPPAGMRTIHRDDLVGKLPPEAAARVLKEAIFDSEGFTRGEVSYWIPSIADSHLDTEPLLSQWTTQLSVGQEIPVEKRALFAQLTTLLVFDLLQNNSDRFSGGNLLTSPDGRTLYFMDNTFGFQVEPEGHEKCRAYLKRAQKFSRSLVARLRQLTSEALREALMAEPGVLTDDEIQSVIARKNVALRYIDSLIAAHGDAAVLVFP